MTIERNGVQIELTETELFNAYYEQQFAFDKEDVRTWLDGFDDDYWAEQCGMARDEMEPFVEAIAIEMRRLLDKYDCDWYYARAEAVRTILLRDADKEPKPTLIMNPAPEVVMSLRNSWLRVDWTDLGEGWNGDYNHEDPQDQPLMRLDVYTRAPEPYDESDNGWTEVEDASYCTRMPVDTKPEILERALRRLFSEYKNALKSDCACSVKNLGESLSWISPADIEIQR